MGKRPEWVKAIYFQLDAKAGPKAGRSPRRVQTALFGLSSVPNYLFEPEHKNNDEISNTYNNR
jgi:hypothetical protein